MQIFSDKIFKNPIEIIEAFDNESFIEAFSRIENLRKKYFLLGYIKYEAKEIFLGNRIKTREPLLYFEIYDKFQNYFLGLPRYARNDIILKSTIHYQQYSNAINKIKDEIACGNTYEVNYTYDYKIETELDGIELYNHILPNQTTPYNAYIKNKYEEILSFSPELFFELKDNKIKTKPMKGTVKRGETEAEDKKNVEFLKNDIKNRAENVMIVDLLRNDLGKIAKTGTVKVNKLFEVETHKTVHQMTSEISAELEENTTLFDIFEAIFPCGSITGAPKINTMKIIDEVEVGKREVYCGAIGLISPEKTIFSVPIRTLQKHNDEKLFSCRVGGAIVWDSSAEEEWDETLTKMKFLDSTIAVGWGPYPTDKIDFKLVETILVENGKMKYAEKHFARMEKSAKELGFKFNSDILSLNPEKNGMLRILLACDGTFETQYLPLNEIKINKITISKTQVQSSEKLLYHKTTFRPWYEEAMTKIKSGLIFDEIFFNEKGELSEGARSNIILQINGKLFTPPVECGLLAGVLRGELLKNRIKASTLRPLGEKVPEGRMRGKKLTEKNLYLDDLKNAEKIFCINSVRGVVEVQISPPPLRGEVCFQLEQDSAKARKQGGGSL